MPSFNRVILIGRLTRDPELRYTASGLAVTTFTIAVDRFQKNEQGERVTDFFRCKAWRQKAEFVQQYIQKGRLVAVDGRIEMSEYTAQDGTRRTSVDIVCDNVETLEPPRDGAAAGAPAAGGYGAPAAPAGGGDYFDDEMAAAPARSQAPVAQAAVQAAPRPQAAAPAAPPQRPQAPQGGAPQGGAPQGAPQRPQGAPGPAGQAPRGAQPQPAYPQNDYDFDDSDPFADE